VPLVMIEICSCLTVEDLLNLPLLPLEPPFSWMVILQQPIAGSGDKALDLKVEGERWGSFQPASKVSGTS